MAKPTFHPMILRLFASPILQTLYRTDRYSNELIDMNNMENNELQQSLIFIEKLIQNKAIELYSLLSTNYDIENASILHRDLIIEILKWSYDTNEYLGKELLNTKHFTAPVLDILSFVSFIIEPIHIINVWILIIFYVIPHFLSLFLLAIMDIKLFDDNCSIYGYIVDETMRMQYFLTIIHLLLCQIIFFINALMPLRSFVRWRRYYKIYLNHCGLNDLIINNNINYDDEPMKLLLFPYHKSTLHGKISNIVSYTDNGNDNGGFTWEQFAASYTLYVFNLYIYNIWSVMYNEEHMFVRRISYYECLLFIIYTLPLIFTLFILDDNWNIKQRINKTWNKRFIVIWWVEHVFVSVLITLLMLRAILLYFDIYSLSEMYSDLNDWINNKHFIGYIYILLDFLSYTFNFIQIIVCTIIGYIHVEWTMRHIFASIFCLKTSMIQNMLIASNTVPIVIWILSTKG